MKYYWRLEPFWIIYIHTYIHTYKLTITNWCTRIPILSNAAYSVFSKQVMVAVAGIDYFISVKKSSLVSKQSSFVWSTRSWANTCSTENYISFWCFRFFFRLRNQPKTWRCSKFSLTFADWSWIVPGTIIARDVRDTNPCIAISAIKPHRSPMSEAFSWSPAMSWWGELNTRCYAIQQEKWKSALMKRFSFLRSILCSNVNTSAGYFSYSFLVCCLCVSCCPFSKNSPKKF